MRIQINNLIFVIILLLNLNLYAAEIFKFNTMVSGFNNFSNINSLLFLSNQGEATWFDNLQISSQKKYNILDAECFSKTQNTAQLENEQSGLTLAYPFFVGLDHACFIDESNQTIKLISNFKKSLPKNSFSISYLAENSIFSFFIINGREFPNADFGYISYLSINKKTLELKIQNLITEVPGYSAALFSNTNEVFVTTWDGQNSIFKIQTDQLINSITHNQLLKFSQIAVKVNSDFDGMSTFMLKNDTVFLYSNKDYETYSINILNGQKQTLNPPCSPISGYGNQWVLLCDENRIELENLK